MDGGALAYADTMGPGKTAALSLRGYLFDDPTLLALEEAGVDIEYPANLRESDQEPKKLKPGQPEYRWIRLSGRKTMQICAPTTLCC